MNVDALRLEVLKLEHEVERIDIDEGDLETAGIDLEEAYSELARVEQELGVCLRRVC